jgi:hypothetical protein
MGAMGVMAHPGLLGLRVRPAQPVPKVLPAHPVRLGAQANRDPQGCPDRRAKSALEAILAHPDPLVFLVRLGAMGAMVHLDLPDHLGRVHADRYA